MTSKWLGGKLDNNVRENPSIQLGDIMEKTNHRFHLGITKSKAYRAKSHAIDLVDGSYRDQYTRMHDYCHELFRSNPDSTVKQSLYIFFKACKESFKSCRPIVGFDGCFLKGYYGEQLLTAIGRDPNDQMMPIAYDVVEGETKETWSWFLDLLANDLGGRRLCNTYTFISDQQKVCLTCIFM